MKTPQDVIAWLDRQTVMYDLRREVHTRNSATIAAAVAAVQSQTVSHLADELRRMVAETQPVSGSAAR